MSGRRAVGGALCSTLVTALGLAPAAAAHWSAPARPAGCSTALASTTPLVVFPSSDPTTRSGPGALLWSAPRGCVVGAPAGEVVGATLAGDDLPGRARALAAGASNLGEVAAAAGTATGQVIAVGGGALAEGKIVGAFGPPRPLGGLARPAVASSSYLGDVAIASAVRTRSGWAIAVRVQRHYGEAPRPARLVAAGTAPIAAVAAAMDYRAEILLVWVSDGTVYARKVSPSGAPQPAQRLGSLGADSSDPELRALLSDDGHAIVAWRSQSAAPGGATTTIALSISGGALDFGAPRLLERFRDPGRFAPPAGSLRLLRLSSEAVMIAWTGLSAGHYVVRASPVSLRRGVWAPVVISSQATESAAGQAAGQADRPLGGPAAGSPADSSYPRVSDAVLADLAAGPDAEAFALWRVAPRLANGAPNRRRWAIRAARGHYAGQGEVSFGAPETVAPAGLNRSPAAAVDPATGRALAAWVTLAGAPHVEYALHTPTPPPLPASAIRSTALACCLGLPYASIDSSAIRIGTPLAACLK